MMVTFVCECEKKALPKTRRVLDAFANRIGSRTWQTVITLEGLDAVKKLLRKTASKNTAVSCHWIRSRSRSELVWVVGTRSKFNAQGIVPVNSTQNGTLLIKQEYTWKTANVIALLSGIAGLFHDFGKANQLFQNKLNPKKKGSNHEPYRHEWVSLRLFQAFVGNSNDDSDWLSDLGLVDDSTEAKVLARLVTDPAVPINNPLSALPRLAKVVAWLIVSHHKLPVYPNGNNRPALDSIDHWLNDSFVALWNSWNCNDEWDDKIKLQNWTFPHGTPLQSLSWRDRARDLSRRASKDILLLQEDWFKNRFTSHLSRLVLMLSDHYYSASDKQVSWQDPRYKAFANTDENGLNQKLDEHNIGVATNAFLLARKLPTLRSELPTLGHDKKFTKHTNIKKFLWQNKAYNLAKSISTYTVSQGFFGINMASTGLGKTLSNARIMVALAGDKSDSRFNVALGLRTLTLQTADALAERLSLDETELGLLVGSNAVKQLHTLNKNADTGLQKQRSAQGSESLADLVSEETQLLYKGALNDGVLSKWLSKSPKLEKLLNAPVLVSTIDYLIPATEGSKGGRQIAPMLRLLTSDLVLDEPDDFGLEDLPALCRLVNWAGMLGSRVLLSTATMPPALAYALFEAYQAGRKDFTAVNGDKGQQDAVCCAWFDEYRCVSSPIASNESFREAHGNFIKKRISKLLSEKEVLRKAKLLDISCADPSQGVAAFASCVHDAIYKLHLEHHQQNDDGKKVSIGLVRMANISPLVAVAQALFALPSNNNHRIHLCIYHSQFPLAIRSRIEERLDAALTRHNADLLWEQAEIKTALGNHSEQNHVFVVLATSVAEVGRDHDYDWAIAEPSSMRSLVQLAGRIQRHRKQVPVSENIVILSKNMKAIRGIEPAYCRPGFETKERSFFSNDLTKILKLESYQQISAIPRIQIPTGKPLKKEKQFLDFVELEQWALFQRLLGFGKENNNARHWWVTQPTWCAEFQKIQPFRKSSPDMTYCLYSDSNDEDCYWTRKDDTSHPVTYPTSDSITYQSLSLATGKQAWLSLVPESIYDNLSERLSVNRKYISKVFGEITLRKDEKNVIEWRYHEVLGVHEVYEHSTEDQFLEKGE